MKKGERVMFNLQIDCEILNEVEATVTNEKFAQYLLSHTTNFASAAFIMQTLLEAIDKAKETLNEEV